MSDRWRSRYGWALAAVALAAAVAAGLVFAWWRTGKPPRRDADALPQPGSEAYREMASSFFAGVAALDADANDVAQAKLERATRTVPQEPAGWANRGLLEIRRGDFEAAARDLERARSLAPESGAIEQLLGLLESRRGRFAEAIAHLRRAAELEPKALKPRFALTRELEREGRAESDAEALRLMGGLLELQPENLVVLLERARLAAKLGDAGALRDAVERLGKLAPSWPPRIQEQYETLRKMAGADLRQAAIRVAFLRNVLVQSPAFRQGLEAVETPAGVVGEPIDHFLRLAPFVPMPSTPDTTIAFDVAPLSHAGNARWASLVAVTLSGEGGQGPALFVANGRELRRADGDQPGGALPFPGGPAATPPTTHGVLALDLNSDALMDFALAGAGGLRLFQQKPDGTFADVSAATGLGAGVLDADAFGAWAADIEMDGDLDVVVGARQGEPSVLRNHGDGTFDAVRPFEGASDLRDFAWADLDQDGDPDAGLADAEGRLRVYDNERAGRFRPRPDPQGLGKVVALAVADPNRDGFMDLLALRGDGTFFRVSDKDEGRAWDVVEVARRMSGFGDSVRLFAADADNNGSADIIASESSAGWLGLGGEDGGFLALDRRLGLHVFAVADLTGDGRLDLAGLSADGRPLRGVGRGTKDYHWQVIRPRAARVFGDGRINSFGVGGEIEVRADLLVQKQVIAGPVVHFGLGDHPTADVARIVWPNGTVQAEFDTKADRAIVAEQRLKGCCPFLFAFDGKAIRFVTDFIWRSPLGLRINAQDTAGVIQTEDWVKIGGDQLVADRGEYDVRITAELWEAHYIDHLSLMVVDHPSGTEIFVDERFARRMPPLAVHLTGPPRPVAYARDDRGVDVTEVVRDRDGRYLDTFGLGPYQGVARDHWVEVELGDDVPRDRPLRLVAQGWTHPTDSSINVALGQGRHDPPRGLALEVATADGGWAVARPDLGFPAGKNKTILVDLDGVFRPGAPRRFRLRTNLEIYWDALATVVAIDPAEAPMKTRRLGPSSAELRPRGYSLMTRASDSAPELPHYDRMIGTGQRWRDLIGYYTRFGDVRDLLAAVDDRYVIANAGDELALRFPAPPAPPEGWVRDFVMIGDGWTKDGDYNTAFSKTVLPLPSHDRPGYDVPPGALEDDPVHRRYPEDWQEYHTRYITPRAFQGGLTPRAGTWPPRRSEPGR